MAWISTSVPFYDSSKLYILTDLSANDVEFTSFDRQKLDLSKYIYLWYRKFYICRDTAWFYEQKKVTLVNVKRFSGFSPNNYVMKHNCAILYQLNLHVGYYRTLIKKSQ